MTKSKPPIFLSIRSMPNLLLAVHQNCSNPRDKQVLSNVPRRRLLAKAKAGRAERIQAERALERKYVAKNELKLDLDTARVQVAVYKLSKAGSLIESGYLALAAEELAQGSWEDELQAAGGNLGYQPQTFIKNVEELRRACIDGEVDKAKLAYITAARSLEDYALASNTAGNLKLL